jgi:pimeloyl-ACP methyl ester carboxylesterase
MSHDGATARHDAAVTCSVYGHLCPVPPWRQTILVADRRPSPAVGLVPAPPRRLHPRPAGDGSLTSAPVLVRKLDRVSSDGLTRPAGDPSLRRELLEAVDQCRSRLAASGIDPSDFDLTTMAADVEDLRRALGLESWNLAAYGSWSRLALEVMRQYPDHVRAAYLDSPQFSQLDDPTEVALGTRLVLDALFRACRAQASCQARYPGLRNQWGSAITRLDARPIEAQTPIGTVLIDGSSFVRWRSSRTMPSSLDSLNWSPARATAAWTST